VLQGVHPVAAVEEVVLHDEEVAPGGQAGGGLLGHLAGNSGFEGVAGLVLTADEGVVGTRDGIGRSVDQDAAVLGDEGADAGADEIAGGHGGDEAVFDG
jgi:hypothetical protein